MAEPEASEATIHLIYRSYYGEMGGAGTPPDVKAQSNGQGTVKETATVRWRTTSPPSSGRRRSRPKTAGGPPAKPRLPVALIFVCLVIVYVGLRYFLALRRTAHGAHSPRDEISERQDRFFAVAMRPAECPA